MHALKNAFQLQNNSKFIWLAGILFSNLIIQALPKIPKLIYLNGFAASDQIYFFLETFKMLKSMFEMFNFSCLLWPYNLLNNISPIYPILSLVLTLTFQPIKNVLILHLFLKLI
jgi:hypothetical protein